MGCMMVAPAPPSTILGDLMLRHPHGAGGFIWASLDEAVLRTDKQGVYDADGNHAPDGIVGPHREKEASYYTIKEIWSPVYIDTLTSSLQQLKIENCYSFTNLRQCTFRWKLCRWPSPKDKRLKPASWQRCDALYPTGYGPDGRELFTWSWGIPHAVALPGITAKHAGGLKTAEDGDALIVSCGSIQYHFDKSTGFIERMVKLATLVSLSGGHRWPGSLPR